MNVPESRGPESAGLARSIGAVALGAFFGAPARYAVAVVLPTPRHGFPWATFIVNVIGAFLLGLLLEATSARGPLTKAMSTARLVAGTGFCGALTTYSTLAVEVDLLVRNHDPGMAVWYAVATVTAGLAATIIGVVVAGAHH